MNSVLATSATVYRSLWIESLRGSNGNRSRFDTFRGGFASFRVRMVGGDSRSIFFHKLISSESIATLYTATIISSSIKISISVVEGTQRLFNESIECKFRIAVDVIDISQLRGYNRVKLCKVTTVERKVYRRTTNAICVKNKSSDGT